MSFAIIIFFWEILRVILKGNTKNGTIFFKKEKICEGLKRFMFKDLISIVSNN